MHDFAAFAAAGSEAKTTVREIWRADVRREGELVELLVSGRSFLYNMVRILAGTLIYIGIGKLPPSACKKRCNAQQVGSWHYGARVRINANERVLRAGKAVTPAAACGASRGRAFSRLRKGGAHGCGCAWRERVARRNPRAMA